MESSPGRLFKECLDVDFSSMERLIVLRRFDSVHHAGREQVLLVENYYVFTDGTTSSVNIFSLTPEVMMLLYPKE